MSYIIIGKQKPICCDKCDYIDDGGDYPRCRITEETHGYNFDTRNNVMRYCPVVALPKQHGRLIDADSLVGVLQDTLDSYPDKYGDDLAIERLVVETCKRYIELCPTIVAAEM